MISIEKSIEIEKRFRQLADDAENADPTEIRELCDTIKALRETSEEWRLLASSHQNWKDLFFAERNRLSEAELLLVILHKQHTQVEDLWLQHLLTAIRNFINPKDDEAWEDMFFEAKDLVSKLTADWY